MFLAVNFATGARCPTVIGHEMMWAGPAANPTCSGTVVAGASSINDVQAMSFSGGSGGSGVDYDALRLSVKADCGAYGDGIHDDTGAIQRCLNKFTNGIAALASGTLYFPAGNYLISNYLYYVGDTSHTFNMLGIGEVNGSTLTCTGSGCSMAMLITLGMQNQSGIHGIGFDGNNHATKGIWFSSTNGVGGTFTRAISPGTQTVNVGSLDQSQGNIAAGSLLNVDSGANTEFIIVSAFTSSPPTITATFRKSHAINTPFGHSNSAGSGTTFENLFIHHITGSPSWGIALGSNFGNEAASVGFVNVSVSGSGPSGPPTYGIGSLSGANTEAFYFYNGNIVACAYGLWFKTNGQVTVINTQFGNSGADLHLDWQNAELINLHSEGSTMFLDDSGGGGLNPQGIVIENCDWRGVAAASGPNADVVISAANNSLTVIDSQFWNMRTSSSLPLIVIGAPTHLPGGYVASFFSEGSQYFNATDYVPIVGYPNNTPWLPERTGNQPLAVTSINDIGGGPSRPARLKSYYSTSILTDFGCGARRVAASGLIRTCNGGVPISFRNYAGTGDVPGMRTNSSDQVVLGGAAGISSTQVQARLYATASNCSSSANPAVCGAAPAGSVTIAASATSVVVSTTAVTANSQISVTADSSLGKKLGVTCNAQSLLVLGVPKVTARTPGANFTVGIEVGPTTSPLCVSYSIVN